MNHHLKSASEWQRPQIPADIPHGDMPGDKVDIGEDHIRKSEIIFRRLLELLPGVMEQNKYGRAVITVCGGSGVGKSETASLLSYYLNEMGIGSYTLSGDNYPNRIPRYNDAERLHIFRQAGVRALVQKELLTEEVRRQFRALQEKEEDADVSYSEPTGQSGEVYSWFPTYLEGALKGLKGYLGSSEEINFAEVEGIVTAFKQGADSIWLKRMGRTECDLWYEKKDFSEIKVLIIEWTHGNSDHYRGVDLPIFLYSTPEETLAHRRSRNRDGKTDSPFTMRVLEIEQGMLDAQSHKAKIKISKAGELL